MKNKMENDRLKPDDIGIESLQRPNRFPEVILTVKDYSMLWREIGELRGEIMGLRGRIKEELPK